MRKTALLLLLSFVITACGFHLRGIADVPKWLDNVYLPLDQDNRALVNLVKTQLEGYKVHLTENPAHAKYWLIISHINFRQQITSVGASTNPRQYQLIYEASYMLQTPQGVIVKPEKNVVSTRSLTVNNDRILGSNEEESLFINEMRQDVATQIINRLSRRD